MNPVYSTLHVQMRSKYGCDQLSSQSATFRIAARTSLDFIAPESLAFGPGFAGASPKCRAMSPSIPC